MGDLVERNAVMNSIIAEYNRKGGRDGLKLAWIEKAVNEVPSTLEQEPKWIPVSERLPEEDEEVLVWYQYWRYGEYNSWFQTYGIGYVINDRWSVIDGGIKTTVFAWMPLPEPYKQEAEDEN